MKYTSVTKIENYLLTDIAVGFVYQIDEWIEVIEAYIDKYTDRNFIADTTASYKTYEIESKKATVIGDYKQTIRELIIDDCVEVEELQIDDKVVSASNYLLYPINSLPKIRIKLKDISGLSFTKGEQNIKVKAKWGSSVDCPPDISFVATVLVAGIVNYSLNAEGEVKSESIGGYSVTYKDEKQWQDLERAKEILQGYKKIIL